MGQAQRRSREEDGGDAVPRRARADGQAHSADPLEDVLDGALEAARDGEVSVGDLADQFGSRSFGPVLVLFGLLALFPPIGAVPGVPIVLGAALLLFAVQFAIGRDRLWLPDRLERVSFDRERLEKADEKARGWLERLDKVFSERLTFATGKVAERAAAICAVLHAFLMIPLEFVSLVAIPGVALTAFGVGLMARDGLFMLIAFAATAAGVAALFWVPWGWLWSSVFG